MSQKEKYCISISPYCMCYCNGQILLWTRLIAEEWAIQGSLCVSQDDLSLNADLACMAEENRWENNIWRNVGKKFITRNFIEEETGGDVRDLFITPANIKGIQSDWSPCAWGFQRLWWKKFGFLHSQEGRIASFCADAEHNKSYIWWNAALSCCWLLSEGGRIGIFFFNQQVVILLTLPTL